ncbi:hypothetical protein D3C84_1028610 [compost metagenome]
MVRVMVGQQHQGHRLVGDGGDGAAHGFAVGPGRPGIDHHDARIGDDETGVDDVAAIGLGEVVGAAFQQPGALGDLPGAELVVLARVDGDGDAGQ